MSTWVWVVIAVAAVAVVLAAVWLATRSRRSRHLRESFGPEYDRTVADAPTRREAEAELAGREDRRKEIDVTPLSPAARDRYAGRWQDVQSRFVDDPPMAVREADSLVELVMVDRGYPMSDFESQADLVSVDHPVVVENYRSAHAIHDAYERGDASTEDLRQAMVHYRALFEELLERDRAEAR
jgi:hypothetical protein